MRDLRERFAKIEIQSSAPIVPFRETAVQGLEMATPKNNKDKPRGTVTTTVQNGLIEYTVRARPLPAEVTAFLTAHIETVKRVVQKEREFANVETTAAEDSTHDTAAEGQGDRAASLVTLSPADFWIQLEALFTKVGKEWSGVMNKIWAFGPRRIGPNILVDGMSIPERS